LPIAGQSSLLKWLRQQSETAWDGAEHNIPVNVAYHRGGSGLEGKKVKIELQNIVTSR